MSPPGEVETDLHAAPWGDGDPWHPDRVVGNRVKIIGLSSRPDLNNTFGTVLEWRACLRKFVVRVVGGDEYLLRPECIELVGGQLAAPAVDQENVCPLCCETVMITLADDRQNSRILPCCNNPLCIACLDRMPNDGSCPFCREPFDSSPAGIIRQTTKRALAGDPQAQFNLGCFYDNGVYECVIDYVKVSVNSGTRLMV